jgi:hypothetical protein
MRCDPSGLASFTRFLASHKALLQVMLKKESKLGVEDGARFLRACVEYDPKTEMLWRLQSPKALLMGAFALCSIFFIQFSCSLPCRRMARSTSVQLCPVGTTSALCVTP